ncbi:MAG: hypothetical protein OXE55_06820 [Flavobacteriaceae bacterium]|nr:hypothetical protein [Flavobacteriaceae bacterium]
MKVQLLDQQIYLISQDSSKFDFVSKFIGESTFNQNPYSIIVTQSGCEKDLDFKALNLISSKLHKLNLILVLVFQNEPSDFLSDEIISVPTLTEAIDYIQLDRIQKELLE